jgi:hypothetical protein
MIQLFNKSFLEQVVVKGEEFSDLSRSELTSNDSDFENIDEFKGNQS